MGRYTNFFIVKPSYFLSSLPFLSIIIAYTLSVLTKWSYITTVLSVQCITIFP